MPAFEFEVESLPFLPALLEGVDDPGELFSVPVPFLFVGVDKVDSEPFMFM